MCVIPDTGRGGENTGVGNSRKDTRDCNRLHGGVQTDRDPCRQTGTLQKMKKISVKLCGLERKANRGAKRSMRIAYQLLLQSCCAMVKTAGRMVWISTCLLYHLQAAAKTEGEIRNQRSVAQNLTFTRLVSHAMTPHASPPYCHGIPVIISPEISSFALLSAADGA